jgi:hypothetical protein
MPKSYAVRSKEHKRSWHFAGAITAIGDIVTEFGVVITTSSHACRNTA